MPRSLFLKLFLWFGAGLFTVIVGTFLVGELTRPEPFRRPQRIAIEPALSGHARAAAEIYERDGRDALVRYLEGVERELSISAFLFNQQLEEVSGRRVPDGSAEKAQRAFDPRPHEHDREHSRPLLTRLTATPGGKEYVLLAELSHPRGPESIFHPIMHLLAIILTGGLFCYWLARHLTSPVGKLRAATQELANGNLQVRVVPAMGNRRDELASLAADFDLMAERIESLINGQRRLLGDISHELRSPLTRLNVALELARQRSGPEAVSSLERIQHEAENLNEMIGQLLTLTRLESGAEVLPQVEFDLPQLLRQVTGDADFEARSRNRSVSLRTVERLVIEGTEHLLHRAVENVVRNAVHYTAEGTTVLVELRMESGADCDHAPAPGGDGKGSKENGAKRCALIMVRDHGPGIPENALREIFRPFYRVDDARDREAGGVGLGLAIAERAIRLHGGSVKAANAADGLMVTICLPL